MFLTVGGNSERESLIAIVELKQWLKSYLLLFPPMHACFTSYISVARLCSFMLTRNSLWTSAFSAVTVVVYFQKSPLAVHIFVTSLITVRGVL